MTSATSRKQSFLNREIKTYLRKIKGTANAWVTYISFFCYYGYNKELPKRELDWYGIKDLAC